MVWWKEIGQPSPVSGKYVNILDNSKDLAFKIFNVIWGKKVERLGTWLIKVLNFQVVSKHWVLTVQGTHLSI